MCVCKCVSYERNDLPMDVFFRIAFLLVFFSSSSSYSFAVIIVERNSYQAKVHVSFATHTRTRTIQSLSQEVIQIGAKITYTHRL